MSTPAAPGAPGEPNGQESAGQEPGSSSDIGRASVVLASGTIVSRILGFISAIVLAQTIGTVGSGADTFAIANTLPNNIFALVAGGVLSAVLVPQIVKAGLHDDGGQRFVNKIVTLGFTVFLLAAVIATLLAPVLVVLYSQQAGDGGRGFSPEETALATAFAYWCLPQVLFYALYSLLGEVLNARRVFGPFTWAPALNNVVAIIGLVAFTLLFSDNDVTRPEQWTPAMIAVLGGSATIGVVAQALVLFVFWRRAGLRFRPDFRWRGVGLASTGRAAGWVFAMIVVMQIAGIVQTRVATLASTDDDPSVATMRFAWLIFMLPHSVIVVSLVVAYFTRMSTHAMQGETALVREDTSAAIRIAAMIMVLATIGLMIVSAPFSRLFTADAVAVDGMARVLIGFVVGLVPFSVYFVMQRVFYAIDDTRTAFLLQVAHSAFFIVGALAVSVLPSPWIVPAIGLVTSAAGAFQMVLGGIVLRKRLGGLDSARVARSMGMFALAAVPSTLVGLGAAAGLGAFSGGAALDSVLASVLAMLLIGMAMSLVYGGTLWLLRVEEFRNLVSPLVRRLTRRA